MRIVFAGTPAFACPILQALIESEHEVCCVYTQPDRPAGRGRYLQASPVKQLAQTHNITVAQPQSLKGEEQAQVLQALAPDVMVVVAYGLLLPASILSIPRLGCINVHGSLLPRWRGAAPIQRAILAGDSETGITIMQMERGLDTGAMWLKQSCAIAETDTGETIHERLAQMGGDMIVPALVGIESGKLHAEAQDDSLATYAHKLVKSEAQIDWKKSAIEIERMVRAFNPWPVAYFNLQGQNVRAWDARVMAQATEQTAGVVINANAEGIDIATGEGVLRLLELQFPGSKRLPVSAILNAKAEQFVPGNSL